MNYEIDLKKIYSDFFREEIPEIQPEENDNLPEIEKLRLTEDSIDLLKRIVSYMKEYNDSKYYVPFGIKCSFNSEKEFIKVLKLLNSTNYLKNNDISIVSLFDIRKIDDFKKTLDSAVIVIKNLEEISSLDINLKKELINEIKQNFTEKHMFILYGTNESIESFINEDDVLRDMIFKFSLKTAVVDSSIILNDVLDINSFLNDEQKGELLKYIEMTLEQSRKDYDGYIDSLNSHIAFSKEIPTLSHKKTNEEIFGELNELVGLEDVKKTFNDLVSLLTFKEKTKDHIKLKDINLHMVFLGNPGTGKTTVARLVGSILHNLGYIREDKLIEVSAKDLIGQYVGQTAPKTQDVINKAMGGVLFIDEAYTLAVKGENSYNEEAIATLIKAMEDNRDDLVVIFAGYSKEMQDFLNSNSGITSRIGYTLNFKDYTESELIKMFENMATKSGFVLGASVKKALSSIIKEEKNKENFGNARFIRNVFEKTVIKHASRTKNMKSAKALKTITEEDVTDK